MLLDNNCSCISCSADLRHPGEKHHCNRDVHVCAKGAGGQRSWECWSDRRWTTDTLCCTYKVFKPYNWWFYTGHLPPIWINRCLYAFIPVSLTSTRCVLIFTGDIIVTINGVSIEGSSHQQILDLIRESTNTLKWVLEMMSWEHGRAQQGISGTEMKETV